MEDVTILSIAPANGWCAVYRSRAGEDEEFRSPAVCWALVEAKDGERSVVGLDADKRGTVEISAYANNFIRYEVDQRMVIRPGESPST